MLSFKPLIWVFMDSQNKFILSICISKDLTTAANHNGAKMPILKIQSWHRAYLFLFICPGVSWRWAIVFWSEVKERHSPSDNRKWDDLLSFWQYQATDIECRSLAEATVEAVHKLLWTSLWVFWIPSPYVDIFYLINVDEKLIFIVLLSTQFVNARSG